ncbi:MAG: helix-turn-helix transcriptional regulator [Leptolyngbya foveolarum]|uniref:Helix-turn-helix transcriptional regulator n=1 Tax=Leptolyngbya foveolarum TaxID=47253 RepID=A0A2W4WCR1_9CYAN|nr:MAG: helix-turn-helix transcriptional regulator [Leptolyngbya foveolarum]
MSSSQSSPSDTQAAIGQDQNESQHVLSPRELQIVELVSAGLTNQEISEELDISKRTVDNHVSNVLNKTNTGNRVALVRWALQSGKVCIDELNCCRLPEREAD